MTPRRGEVWVANFTPSQGRERGKLRPILVIHTDELIATATPVIVVLPITTQIYPDRRK